MALTLTTKEFPETYVNPRGIPRVAFVDSVEQYVKSRGITVESILKQFQEQHSKYKLMEHKLAQNRSHLASKIPEITKTTETLQFLRKKLAEEDSGFKTNYGLTESVFCEAEVTPQKTVHLWLGASVMVEYTFDEAIALLGKNLAAAKKNLESTVEDLAWLSDQLVILEVNTARVYNYDVVKRREEKEKGSQ
eukprot:CAMPEP_0176428084 /NCGR_PEP_ID=MMETSP0127-20121128/12950_1 /TAXON_ID=938130 /ORGANISM="Platyophrya macrostoma, Strain WH" /LENGTH=191 /DNA_ID=CAMNT_0017809721 /DNA_START=32 /DNA_END=607 /DNA_ORIENTATION=+